MKRVLAGLLAGALLTLVFTAFASAAPSRGVVVLLDTSGSMAPDRIVVARQAIATYVSGLPADVQVGLVAFSSQPTLVLAPTADRGAVAGALDRLQAWAAALQMRVIAALVEDPCSRSPAPKLDRGWAKEDVKACLGESVTRWPRCRRAGSPHGTQRRSPTPPAPWTTPRPARWSRQSSRTRRG